ncbi:hypothetical protein HKD37_01G001143 [Glycine soja]
MSMDYIKMKAFPFSWADTAKDWLYFNPASIKSWNDMKRQFLEKFFPASRTTTIRKDISGTRQLSGETMHEYRDRIASSMERSMVDAANGGTLMDKTATAARQWFFNMAHNSQQFSTRVLPSRGVHDETLAADYYGLENQITELTSLVKQLDIGQHQQVQEANIPPPRACGICTSLKHPSDACRTLQETEPTADVVGIITGPQYRPPQQQEKYDHPNLKYGSVQVHGSNINLN